MYTLVRMLVIEIRFISLRIYIMKKENALISVNIPYCIGMLLLQ